MRAVALVLPRGQSSRTAIEHFSTFLAMTIAGIVHGNMYAPDRYDTAGTLFTFSVQPILAYHVTRRSGLLNKPCGHGSQTSCLVRTLAPPPAHALFFFCAEGSLFVDLHGTLLLIRVLTLFRAFGDVSNVKDSLLLFVVYSYRFFNVCKKLLFPQGFLHMRFDF